MKALSPPTTWTSQSTRTASTPLNARVTTRAAIPTPRCPRPVGGTSCSSPRSAWPGTTSYPQEQHGRPLRSRTNIELLGNLDVSVTSGRLFHNSLSRSAQSLNPLPHHVRGIDAGEAFQGHGAGRRGDVDLGQIVADHVDADEDQAPC